MEELRKTPDAVQITDYSDMVPVTYVALSEEGCNDETDATVFRKAMASGEKVEYGTVTGVPVFG